MTTFGSTASAQGTLTTSNATLHTAAAGSKEESIVIVFQNYSGSTVTVELFSGGTADVNRLGAQAYTLLTKEMLVLKLTLAANDDVRAVCSANTSVAYRKAVRKVS